YQLQSTLITPGFELHKFLVNYRDNDTFSCYLLEKTKLLLSLYFALQKVQSETFSVYDYRVKIENNLINSKRLEWENEKALNDFLQSIHGRFHDNTVTNIIESLLKLKAPNSRASELAYRRRRR
ncbi:MAG: hypothetical protein ACRDBQ_11700, partial [Shewanella sp.]